MARTQDLLSFARLLNHPAAVRGLEKSWASRLTTAAREDLKERKKAGMDGDGQDTDRQRAKAGAKSADTSHAATVTRELIRDAQKMLKGQVIRRTTSSPDWTGKVIWGAAPPHENSLYLKCNEKEQEALSQLADSSSKTNLLGFENVSAFRL